MALDRYSFTLSQVNGSKTKLHFDGARLFEGFSVLLFSLIAVNVLGSCVFTLTCGIYLPTVSLVGSLVSHDRLLVLTCTFAGLVGQFLAMGVLSELYGSLSRYERGFVYVTLSFCSVCLVLTSVIDEVNGFIIHPMDSYHVLFSLSALLTGLAWLYFVYDCMSQTRPKNNPRLILMKRVLVALVVTSLLAVIEWIFANSLLWNFLLNENVEALCEWAMLGLAAATPAVVGHLLPDFRVSLSLHHV